MSRYINDIDTGRKADEIDRIVSGYLEGEGFEKIDHEGRRAWKKGKGFMISPQYILVEPSMGTIRVEAWIRFAILPGVYLGEMGTAGAFGTIPKRKLRARVEHLEELLTD
ncbi:hypothetical protein BMS3Abin01_00206 [bacterium BMS3Abin01]|nr:hypothetical protein BMS3Abin01_00206 [bacterium BMS3Abin01]HDZ59606.1 hypothetical protein [Actinomycetota bacterium]